MGFYESVKQTADAAGEKIGLISDIARVKIEIADAQIAIKKMYEGLGKAVYFNESEEEISAFCAKLDAKRDELERLESRLAKLKGKKECKNCGRKNAKDAKDAKYCDDCGSEL